MKDACFQTLTLAFDQRGVATLCPLGDTALHAFDALFVHEMAWAVAMAVADPRIRVVVLALEPRLHALPTSARPASAPRGEVASLLEMIDEGGKPFIAVVNGLIVGDAAALCCACDVVLSTTQSMFALGSWGPDTPPQEASLLMPWLASTLGRRTAQRLVLTGEVFDAARALELHMLTETATQEELPSVAARMAERTLARSPALALARMCAGSA